MFGKFNTLQRRGKFISILFIVILLLGIGILVSNSIFASKQARINVSPLEVIELWQQEGYQVDDITEYDEPKNLGMIGNVDYYISLHIEVDKELYKLLVIQYSSWEKARLVARNSNKLARKMNNYAFYFGEVCVIINSFEEKLGKELLAVLDKNYQ
jgi:hypothetical protein